MFLLWLLPAEMPIPLETGWMMQPELMLTLPDRLHRQDHLQFVEQLLL
jgi:hypothetical protein